jgi:hypothetical protein
MPDDIGDPKLYLAGATQILAEYPDEVIKAICTPASGTRLLPDFPTLRQLRVACEEAFAPIERQYEREQAQRDAMRGRLPPRLKRTPEQQAKVDAQVAEARIKLGIGAKNGKSQAN